MKSFRALPLALRQFVLWIAMVAVPFQGYAAVAMVFCGPVNPSAVVGPSAERAAHPHADEVRDAQADLGPATDPVRKDAAHAHPGSAQPDAMHQCGTCGACHATALIGTLEPVVPRDVPRAEPSEVAVAVSTLAPRLLDRPPRA